MNKRQMTIKIANTVEEAAKRISSDATVKARNLNEDWSSQGVPITFAPAKFNHFYTIELYVADIRVGWLAE